jgi:hypothetical protein
MGVECYGLGMACLLGRFMMFTIYMVEWMG